MSKFFCIDGKFGMTSVYEIAGWVTKLVGYLPTPTVMEVTA
jgi:hypothetical protein